MPRKPNADEMELYDKIRTTLLECLEVNNFEVVDVMNVMLSLCLHFYKTAGISEKKALNDLEQSIKMIWEMDQSENDCKH